MDNDAFHDKKAIKEILQRHGHQLMPLPPYSPDFNPIEKSFALIKRKRAYQGASLEEIIMGNC